MKVTNWCRKLSAAFVAGGLLVPCAASAAGLGTNLVTNGDFENVDLATVGTYSSVKILDWTDGSVTGFAYAYSQNYDIGNPLTGGGLRYFTSNGTALTGDPDVTAPGQVAQKIDVSSGATAAAIGAGSALYSLSAFFTTYHGQDDIGTVHLRFMDAAMVGISSVLLSDSDPTAGWKQESTSGSVPVGTSFVQVSVYGATTVIGQGPDGYIDNVDLRIVPEPSTVAIAGIGLAAVGLGLRRRRDES